ncbi:hypothetical protein PoB_007410500 [Plakobranchus ocellatus]|uniref:Uncharacterized protein n=1 Tax=Plakobranchus ocellatus TaxID=259542 RepID=A0AAV4DUF7_9GAST|nr:hypothetical protein PoB_007410500 [Plakobranchus ocellatus]
MAGERTPAHSVTVTVSDWQSLSNAGRKEWQGRACLLIVSLSLCQIGSPCVSREGKNGRGAHACSQCHCHCVILAVPVYRGKGRMAGERTPAHSVTVTVSY